MNLIRVMLARRARRRELFAVASTKDIEILKERDSFVSVLLADSFDRSFVTWIYEAWEPLHFESGMDWHLAVPSRRSVFDLRDSKSRFTVDDYNVGVAELLRKAYGIDRKHLPCMVFDDFDRSKKMAYISLGDRTAHQLKLTFLEISKQIKLMDFEMMSKRERWAFLNTLAKSQKKGASQFLGTCANAASIVSLVTLL